MHSKKLTLLAVIFALLAVIPASAASTNTMYVVTSIKEVQSTSDRTYNYTWDIKYKQNGLIEEHSQGYTKGCKYNKDGVLKQEGETKYKIKNGVRVKSVSGNSTLKYKWKEGKCVEVKGDTSKRIYTYDTKGNMIKEEVFYNNELNYTYEYTYNEKGHRLTYDFWSKTSGLSSTKYGLKYKNDRLKKVEYKSASLDATITYYYTKVKVPKKLVDKVNAQQNYIQNEWRVKKAYILNEFFG